MRLAPDTKLGSYEITGLLGAGGMGEVYRARDTRLGRDVAIKILPPQFSSDPVRKQRFEREAKAISGLNHPHICVLHDVGHQDGVDYLVMECIEGETLASRLKKGPLPLEQVLKYGAQIADALDKAHRSGVVHRDLKPGNIMLTPTGAKLLDFGLAKATAPATSVGTLTLASPASPVTEQGTIVGTFQYMSPEQVEGEELDGRSDIFSLGAALYEMLTGRHAFEGKSQLSVASAILEKEPAPISTVKPLTPPALDHAIRKCLAKLPDDRWQSASDLASELKWIAESGMGAVDTSSPLVAKSLREKLAWLIACALLIALVAVVIGSRKSVPLQQTMYFPAPMSVPARDTAVAPNGHTVAVAAYLESARKNAIWIYELGSASANALAGTEGGAYPFWSPDSRSIAFFADAKLKRIDLPSGPVRTLCDAPFGRGGTWNKDGGIIFAPQVVGGLYRVSASGGAPASISSPDQGRGEVSHRWPMFLPDGKHYLYLAANFGGQKGVNAIFVGSLDSQEKHFVMESAANAAYAPPGYLLFYRDKTLFAQPFDLKRFALTGEPTIIMADVQFMPQVKKALFAVSYDGLLVAQSESGVTLSRPVWFDRKGNELGGVGKPDVYGNVSLAPDGRSVAVDKTDITNQFNIAVWNYDLNGNSAMRLTFNAGLEMLPVWSPDSSRFVFSSNRQTNQGVYMKTSDGTQEDKPVVRSDLDVDPNDWSRDGKYILYTQGTDLWFVTLPELKSNSFIKAASVIRNANSRRTANGWPTPPMRPASGRFTSVHSLMHESNGKYQRAAVNSQGGEPTARSCSTSPSNKK